VKAKTGKWWCRVRGKCGKRSKHPGKPHWDYCSRFASKTRRCKGIRTKKGGKKKGAKKRKGGGRGWKKAKVKIYTPKKLRVYRVGRIADVCPLVRPSRRQGNDKGRDRLKRAAWRKALAVGAKGKMWATNTANVDQIGSNPKVNEEGAACLVDTLFVQVLKCDKKTGHCTGQLIDLLEVEFNKQVVDFTSVRPNEADAGKACCQKGQCEYCGFACAKPDDTHCKKKKCSKFKRGHKYVNTCAVRGTKGARSSYAWHRAAKPFGFFSWKQDPGKFCPGVRPNECAHTVNSPTRRRRTTPCGTKGKGGHSAYCDVADAEKKVRIRFVAEQIVLQ